MKLYSLNITLLPMSKGNVLWDYGSHLKWLIQDLWTSRVLLPYSTIWNSKASQNFCYDITGFSCGGQVDEMASSCQCSPYQEVHSQTTIYWSSVYVLWTFWTITYYNVHVHIPRLVVHWKYMHVDFYRRFSLKWILYYQRN